MNWRGVTAALGWLVVGGLVSGCHTYKYTEQPTIGAPVRVVLTTEGAVRQSELLGEPRRTLTGNFVGSDAAGVHIDVITGASRGTFNEIILRDTLAIPTQQVATLEEREISWIRTGIVAVGVGVAAVLGVSSITSGGSSEGSGPGTPPPTLEGIRFPIFRIGW